MRYARAEPAAERQLVICLDAHEKRVPVSIHKQKGSFFGVPDGGFKLGDVSHRPPVDFLDHVALLQSGAGRRTGRADFDSPPRPTALGGSPSPRATCGVRFSTETPSSAPPEPLIAAAAAPIGSFLRIQLAQRDRDRVLARRPARLSESRSNPAACWRSCSAAGSRHVTDWPFTSRMMSPFFRPAFCAGLLASTSPTSAPSESFTPNCRAMVGVTSCG